MRLNGSGVEEESRRLAEGLDAGSKYQVDLCPSP